MTFAQQKIYTCILLLFAYVNCISQNVSGETHTYDCYQFKRIAIPFTYGDTSLEKEKSPFYKKLEFHSKTHDFTDWYRIAVKENQTLSFKVSPVNINDSFAISFYKYSEAEDFCTKVYENKVNPVKSYSYKNIKHEFISSLNEKILPAQSTEVYYLCVTGTTISNCGHTLRLNTGTDTLLMVSTYAPCTFDTAALVIKNLPKQNLVRNPLPLIYPDVNNTQSVKNVQSFRRKTSHISSPSIKTERVKDLVLPAETGESRNTDAFINMKCILTDGEKDIRLDGSLRIVDELTGKVIQLDMVDMGEFNFNIEKNKNYKVEGSALGYRKFDSSVKLSQIIGSKKLYILNLEPLKAGNNFVMKNIYFHPNTYALKTESQAELIALLDYMNTNSSAKIEIQGYTSGDRKIKKNKAYKQLGEQWNFQGSAKNLSKYRADAIKQYLILQDVSPERITTKGYGGEKMIVKNPKSLKDIQKNIRVEVAILEN